jgi:hypothetical protein
MNASASIGRVAIVATALALSGCGSVATTKLNVTSKEVTSFAFRDERPLELRLSYKNAASYGETTRLGDDSISPSGPVLVKAWLHDKLGARLAGKKIVLTEFSVEVFDPAVSINEQNFQNAMASTPGAGPLAGALARLLVGGIESARSDKTVGVKIGGKIDDDDFNARGGGAFKGRVLGDDINSVITQALDNTVSEIDKVLSAPKEKPDSTEVEPAAGPESSPTTGAIK